MCSGPFHWVATMNRVRPSGLPSVHEKASPVDGNRLQHLAALPDAHAVPIRYVGVPRSRSTRAKRGQIGVHDDGPVAFLPLQLARHDQQAPVRGQSNENGNVVSRAATAL